MKIGITGHRPQRLIGQCEKVRNWINESFKRAAAQEEKIELITGMAVGVDQIEALTALEQGIGVYCYFPYRHELHPVEEYIAGHAAEVRYISEEYWKECYTKRDRRIVDDCDVLMVVWDGKFGGGTWETYRYALEVDKPVWVYPWDQEVG